MRARAAALVLCTTLSACGQPSIPASDMAGCAVRITGPATTQREAADCAVSRAEKEKAQP